MDGKMVDEDRKRSQLARQLYERENPNSNRRWDFATTERKGPSSSTDAYLDVEPEVRAAYEKRIDAGEW